MRIHESVFKTLNEPWDLNPATHKNTPEGSPAQASDAVSLAELHRVLTPALGRRCLEQLTTGVVRGSYLPPSPEVSRSIVEEHLAAA